MAEQQKYQDMFQVRMWVEYQVFWANYYYQMPQYFQQAYTVYHFFIPNLETSYCPTYEAAWDYFYPY